MNQRARLNSDLTKLIFFVQMMGLLGRKVGPILRGTSDCHVSFFTSGSIARSLPALPNPWRPVMEYTDKTMECADCQAKFVHSGEDQRRYAERGFSHEPKRCPDCRQRRRSSSGARSFPAHENRSRGPRQLHPAVCAGCGAHTEVPFEPKQDRPVYCRDCYRARRP